MQSHLGSDAQTEPVGGHEAPGLLASSDASESESAMPLLVHLLPTEIGPEHLEEFEATLADLLERHRSVVIDCSALAHLSGTGMRVLQRAARRGEVSIANPTPVVRLLASVFGVSVSPRGGGSPPHLYLVDACGPVVHLERAEPNR